MNEVDNALALSGVSKHFGGLAAVRDISLEIPHGQRRALIGPNGAGKTTLFNLIAGDLRVTRGRITLFGRDVTRMSTHRRVELGLRRTYQTSALFDRLTVLQNLYLGVLGPASHWMHLDPVTIPQRDTYRMDRVLEVAEAVGISHRLGAPAGELGHGERRQLELGLAVAWKPRLIMLDEPAAGLSSDERGVLMGLIRNLDSDVTVLLIEHDMEVALNIAEQVTVLHDGAIIANGTPWEISTDAMVQQVYLGEGLYE